jgi:hypothetical protein
MCHTLYICQYWYFRQSESLNNLRAHYACSVGLVFILRVVYLLILLCELCLYCLSAAGCDACWGLLLLELSWNNRHMMIFSPSLSLSTFYLQNNNLIFYVMYAFPSILYLTIHPTLPNLMLTSWNSYTSLSMMSVQDSLHSHSTGCLRYDFCWDCFP